MELTKEKLKKIYNLKSDQLIDKFFDFIIEYCEQYEINTKERLAMFLAQIGHESGRLMYTEEIASGAAYEGRKDLGNTKAGYGVKYKGRGSTLTGNGTSSNPIIIVKYPDTNFSFMGGVTVTGNYYQFKDCNFYGGVWIEGDYVEMNTDTISSTLYLNEAYGFSATNSVMENQSPVYVIKFPGTDFRGKKSYNIDYNTYENRASKFNVVQGNDTVSNGFTGWRLLFPYFDKNSEY